MALAAVSTYRPCWADARGRRSVGDDEDAVTLAVAALQPLVDAGFDLRRVVVVSRQPAAVEGDTRAVVAHALRRPDLPVEEHLGGAPEVVDLLTTARAGTAVVGVDLGPPAAAGAALVGDGPALAPAGRLTRGMPYRSWPTGEAGPHVYDDPRLQRESGWRPALAALAAGAPRLALAGLPARAASALAPAAATVPDDVAVGPAAVAFALAALGPGGGRLVGVEQATACAVDLAPAGAPAAVPTFAAARDVVPAPTGSRDRTVDIPFSLASYTRAFPAKVGLLASRDGDGTLHHPPRAPLPGEDGATAELVPLPRDATVYTTTTVRVPVPGMRTPYSLAIVDLGDTEVRALVPVADAPAGSVAIGDRGRLVLRKVADRHGVADYGYAFQPTEVRT